MHRILSLASVAALIPVSALLIVLFTEEATGAEQRLMREVVVDGLRSPWAIAFVSADEALITEKEGGLKRVHLRKGSVTDITNLPGDIVTGIRAENRADNGGWFDIAIDPDFKTNSLVYLSYAAQNADGRTTKVIRARLDGNRLNEIETLLVAEPYTQDEFFHYGGGLAFGTDGRLYITIGERIFNETSNPEWPIAQDVTDRRGKIFRLERDGSIPPDNPDFGDDAVPGLYAIGIRAAQGIALDPHTGALWFSEHGSRQGDEINRLVAGANYGWPLVTTGGYRDAGFTPPSADDLTLTDPVWSWGQTVAPTGLAFYQGAQFSEWEGDLLVSGLSRGSLWRLNFDDGRIVSVEELFVHERIRSRDVGVAPDGAVYQLTDTLFSAGTDGRLDYSGTPGGALLRIRPLRAMPQTETAAR